MSFLDSLFLRCKICKKFKADRVLTISGYGIYSEREKWYYHESCLQDVLSDPMKHSHAIVDAALEIVDHLETKKAEQAKYEIYLEKKRNEQLAKIQRLKSARRE